MRRHTSLGCFALTAITASLLLGASPFAMAASFDCAKAGTLVEKTLCGNADLGKLDESVAQTYQQLLVSVGSPWDDLVKKSQREWLKARNDDVNTSAPGKEMVDALTASLKARLASLNRAVTTQNGLRFLTVDRLALHKLDKTDIPADSAYARQRYVRQSRSPVYLLSDVPGAKAFNARMDKDFALPKEPAGGSSEETGSAARVNFASPELLSITIISDYFGIGAAHPMAALTQFNYLLAEGKTLTAKDIFTGKAYGDIITRHVTNQFKKADLEPFAKPAEVRALLLDPQNWALSPKGLEIIITPDSLFSHAVGSPEIPALPWKTFKGQLTPLATKLFGQ